MNSPESVSAKEPERAQAAGAGRKEGAAKRGDRRILACALLVVLFAALVKYHPLLSREGTRIGHDWAYAHQPDAIHANIAWKEGSLFPFWSPYLMGGCALYAVPSKPFTYPPFMAAAGLLGPFLGMNLLTFLHILLGGLGMVILMRRLGCGTFPAVVSALLFMLTPYPGEVFLGIPFWGYAVAYWPFVFICVLDILEKPRPFQSGILLGLLLALQLHAGGEFCLYYLGCFLGAFLILLVIEEWKGSAVLRLLAAGGLALAVFAGLSAVKLLPALEWIETSGRGAPLPQKEIFTGYERFAEFDVDHPILAVLYGMTVKKRGGLSVLGLFLLAGLVTGFRRRTVRALAAGTVFCLLLGLGVFHDLFYDFLPGYDRMRMPHRFFYPAGMGAILIAGLGVDALWKGMARLRSMLPATLAGALILAAVLFYTNSLPLIRYWTTPFKSVRPQLERATLVYRHASTDARPGRAFYPNPLNQAFWILLGIESVAGKLGGGGSANREYAEWLDLELHRTAGDLERDCRGVLDVLNTRWLGSIDPLQLPHLEQVYPLKAKPTRPPDAASAGNQQSYVYRRNSCLDRASTLDDAILVKGDESNRIRFLRQVLQEPSFDPRRRVFIEDAGPGVEGFGWEETDLFSTIVFAGRRVDDPDVIHWQEITGRGRIVTLEGLGTVWERDEPIAASAEVVRALDPSRIRRWMNSVEIDLEGVQGRFLLLSEVWALHPGWRALIDGKPARLLRADGLITALLLPPGARRAYFSFLPPGFAAGAWITGLSLAALLLAWRFSHRAGGIGRRNGLLQGTSECMEEGRGF